MLVIGIGRVSFQISFMIDYITWGDPIATQMKIWIDLPCYTAIIYLVILS